MMSKKREYGSSLIASTILWSLGVHTLFVVQAWFAIGEGSLIYSGWPEVVFRPHGLLIISLPPGFPFDDTIVSNWKIAAKILDAYPASLLYGYIIALIAKTLVTYVRNSQHKGVS